jgi:hypothetical protein
LNEVVTVQSANMSPHDYPGRKRWLRVAAYVLVGLIGLMGLIFTVILNMDLGRFEPQIESAITEAIGREFEIEGDLIVEVDLGRIRVAATGIRLAGAEWSTEANLARIGRFETSVNVPSFLSGPIRIESVDVEAVRVNLEVNETGKGNWEFFPADEPVEEEEAGPPGDLPVVFDQARIVDVALVYDDPDRPKPLRFNLVELTVDRDDEDYLDLHLDAALNDTAVGLDARAGQVASLVEYRNLKIDLAGNLGEIELDGNVTIDSLLEPRRPTMQLTVSGPSVEYLSEKLEVEPVTQGPLNLSASIAPLGDDMQLNLNGDIGEFIIDLSGRFQDLQALEDVSLRVAANGPDAGTIARLLGNPNVPEDPFSVSASIQRVGTRIDVEELAINVGKTRFVVDASIEDYRRPAGAHALVRINGPDFGRFNRLLGLPGKLTGPFNLEIDVEPQPDSANVRVAANAVDVKFTVTGAIADTPDLSGTNLRVDFEGPNLKTVTDAFGLEAAPSSPFTLGMDIERLPDGVGLRDGKINIGDDAVGFAGLVGNSPLEADTDLSFEIEGPNLASTLVAFGLDADELPAARYRASGRVERAEESFILHDIAAAIGDKLEYELTAEGAVTDHPELVGTSVQLRVNGVSLRALTDAAGVSGMPNAPFMVAASLERVDNGFAVEEGTVTLGEDKVEVRGLIGESPLERDTDVRFKAMAKDLKATLASFGIDAEAVPAGQLDAGGEIRSRDNAFELRSVNASLAGATASATGQLGAMPSLNGTDIALEIKGVDLARLLPPDENFAKLTDPFRVFAKVRVRNDVLTISDAAVDLPGLDATAALEVAMVPFMGQGRFTISANSPDLALLTPKIEGLLLTEKVPLQLKSSGEWDQKRWTLNELDLALARGTLVGSGTVGGPPNFDDTDLTLDLSIASLRTLSALAGRELPDDEAQLAFHIVGSRGEIRMDRFDGSFGDSDVSGSFKLRNADVPEIEVRLSSSRLTLAPYLAEGAAEEEVPEEEPPPAESDRRVIPDTPIPMEELKKLVASVDVDIKELDLGAKVFSDILLTGSLADGALNVEKIAARNNVGGSVRGALRLRPADDVAELWLDLVGSNLILGMSAETEEELAALPRYELDTVLVSSGATVRDLAASLNGYVRLVGGEGRLEASALRFFTGDFMSEVVSTVNPFAETDPYTNFKCAVVLAQIEDGIATGKPILVAQTDRMKFLADADIDLGTEQFSAGIRTVPQKGLGLSVGDLLNPFVRLGGTFANPALTIDPEGALIEGGAAVATGGISILAKRFKERFIDDKDACGTALSAAEPTFTELREKYRHTKSSN